MAWTIKCGDSKCASETPDEPPTCVWFAYYKDTRP